jgi:Xaa-Pro aminopeptidase
VSKNSFISILLALLICAVDVLGQVQNHSIYDTDLMSPLVFKAHRENLMKEIGDGSVAFFFAAPQRNRNNDVDYQYRQNDNFYYLTGMSEPNSAVALIPSGVNVKDLKDSSKTISVREILFVQPRDSARELWVGRRLGPEGAMEVLGFEYAQENDQFGIWVGRLISASKIAYAPPVPTGCTEEIAGLTKPLSNAAVRLGSLVEFRDPTRIVAKMRAVKSPEEISMIQKAVDITCDAHRQVMMSAEPGMHEYELQAVFEYVFRREGAEYTAYPCIVGGGENSVILHYNTNRRMLSSGDIVVMDCAAEYHDYAADVTRTIPINGTFTDAQREIYELVLQAQQEAIKMMKPGADFQADVQRRAVEVIQTGLMNLGIIRSKDEYKKFFPHGVGHPVGLCVHDVGGEGKLEPGMVWTIEPGIYIPDGSPGVDPKYYNTGVRIEDDVLITENGNKVMSAAAPKTIEEIERLMKKRGIGNEPIR